AGRVDAARAIVQSVVTESSLNLGFYPYPQSELHPTRTAVTYTNLGGAPLELALSVGSQDGTGAPPPGASLAASHVTVPAGGQAQVDLVLDPSVAGAGSYSGVLSADGGSPGTQVRTAFGFGIESEHYDLTVQVRPRAGMQHAVRTVGVIGLESGS